jgi:hypothetical protein
MAMIAKTASVPLKNLLLISYLLSVSELAATLQFDLSVPTSA